MAHTPPIRPRTDLPFVNIADSNNAGGPLGAAQPGKALTHAALSLESVWRNTVAGFISVPCQATGKNAVTLIPVHHEEGSRNYDSGRKFTATAEQTSDGAVTAFLSDVKGNALPAKKVYVLNGKTQAGSGDLVANRSYTLTYDETLDSGSGGFIADTPGKVVDSLPSSLATQTGWTADSGAADRVGHPNYSAVAAVGYVQADIQALMDVVTILTKQVKAMKDDLLAAGIFGA